MVEMESIDKLKEYAKESNIPIMQDGGINFLIDYIKKNNVKSVLEIGTAIGYSAISMCLSSSKLEVVSIERDEKRYLEAVDNVKAFKLEDRIHLIYNDALNVRLQGKYDLIFIDAAKAQNRKFFEKFQGNLASGGTIITDNMNFHGLVNKDLDTIESKNLRSLVRKIQEYRKWLEENKEFKTDIYNVGDGVAVSVRV